jgi:hypothetical protein
MKPKEKPVPMRCKGTGFLVSDRIRSAKDPHDLELAIEGLLIVVMVTD